jgi:hypothetical protein
LVEDFRKKSSFFQIPPIKKAMLRLSPTYLQSELSLNLDDYGEKERSFLLVPAERGAHLPQVQRLVRK